MQGLAPSIDGSYQANETARLQGLAPSIDGSFQVNEAARMQALVNGINPATDVPGTLSGTVTSDGSFQANETARLQGLAPSIDGSFQVNEAARMQALVNGINPATDVPGTLGGTVTSDGSFQANETARLQSLEPRTFRSARSGCHVTAERHNRQTAKARVRPTGRTLAACLRLSGLRHPEEEVDVGLGDGQDRLVPGVDLDDLVRSGQLGQLPLRRSGHHPVPQRSPRPRSAPGASRPTIASRTATPPTRRGSRDADRGDEAHG